MAGKMKNIMLLLSFVALLLGGGSVYLYRQWLLAKTVAFRVSIPEDKLDYDLYAAINYLKQQFQVNGYRFAGTSFTGNLYPKELDDAKINVFIRGQNLFYDSRQRQDSLNIFYLHRYSHYLHNEETRNFDLYMSSQKDFFNFVEKDAKKIYIPAGAVKHKVLKPDYKYSVLVIYEWWDSELAYTFQNYSDVKLIGCMNFIKLSQEEREKLLAQAVLVLYLQENNSGNDINYVPYAVYDIISYGRPVMTNYSQALFNTMGDNVFYFSHVSDIGYNIDIALRMARHNRENKALKAREKLFQLPGLKLSLFN